MMKLYVAILVLCSIVDRRAEAGPGSNDILDGLKQTFNVLEKLLLFFEEQVSAINLDGIYGLRVAQGAFKISLTEHSEGFWNGIPQRTHIRQQLIDLVKRTGLICDRAQSSIKKQGESYFDKFKDIVDKPWPFFVKFGQRKLPAMPMVSLDNKDTRIDEWDENMSDTCMSEALGSNNKHIKCLFSEKCMTAMSDKNQIEYGLTHHILFLTLAKINKCEKKYSLILLQHIGIDVDGVVERDCLSIMAEMVALEDKGVPEDQEDLYLEQGFVCGMQGYEEFLSLDRLKRVLGRQLYPGCFGNISNYEDDEDMDERRSSRDNRGHHGNPESYQSMRRLLDDVTLKYGCSSHESGVAAGFLGIYTKWLLSKLMERATTSSLVLDSITIPLLQLSISNQVIKLQGTAHAEHKENEMYSIVIVSVVTTILTLVVVFALYKLLLAVCCDHKSNQYRKLKDVSNDKDAI